MKAIPLLILICIVSAVPAFSAPQSDTCRIFNVGAEVYVDPGICDTVRIGCPIIMQPIVVGDSVAIPIYLWNDEPIPAFTLGFTYNSDQVEITSWETGSIIPQYGQKRFTAVPELNQYLIGWFSFSPSLVIQPTISSAGALLGTLYMRILPVASDTVIDLDSTCVGAAGKWLLSLKGGGKASPLYSDCSVNDIVLGSPSHLVYLCGDIDGTNAIDVADAVYLISYIFSGGPAPSDKHFGDVNCDNSISIVDAVYLINYIFADGPAPCRECETPTILSITAVPDTVGMFGSLELRVNAYDPNGDVLRYSYLCKSGQFSGNGSVVTWTSYPDPGDWTIIVTVTDGYYWSRDSIVVTVLDHP